MASSTLVPILIGWNILIGASHMFFWIFILYLKAKPGSKWHIRKPVWSTNRCVLSSFFFQLKLISLIGLLIRNVQNSIERCEIYNICLSTTRNFLNLRPTDIPTQHLVETHTTQNDLYEKKPPFLCFENNWFGGTDGPTEGPTDNSS